MFDFLKRKRPGKEPELSAIWEETDENHFVTELSARVAEKCAYGDDFSALSPAERVFYLTQTCEEEAFRAIGAPKTADICARAMAALGQAFPEDRETRQTLLELREKELAETLQACDEAFLRYEEDLTALNAAYVRAHREDFS